MSTATLTPAAERAQRFADFLTTPIPHDENTRRIDTLRAEGHPKWKSVDLTDIPPGWDVGACVNRGLDPGYQAHCTAPRAQPESLPDSEANSAYRRNICAVIGC